MPASRTARGEMVLMLALPAEAGVDAHREHWREVAALMQAEGLSGEKDAPKRVARELRMGKSEAYRELQQEQKRLQ